MPLSTEEDAAVLKAGAKACVAMKRVLLLVEAAVWGAVLCSCYAVAAHPTAEILRRELTDVVCRLALLGVVSTLTAVVHKDTRRLKSKLTALRKASAGEDFPTTPTGAAGTPSPGSAMAAVAKHLVAEKIAYTDSRLLRPFLAALHSDRWAAAGSDDGKARLYWDPASEFLARKCEFTAGVPADGFAAFALSGDAPFVGLRLAGLDLRADLGLGGPLRVPLRVPPARSLRCVVADEATKTALWHAVVPMSWGFAARSFVFKSKLAALADGRLAVAMISTKSDLVPEDSSVRGALQAMYLITPLSDSSCSVSHFIILDLK
eukprot:gene8215-12678_t